jgi:hypothetical protein
MTEGYILWCQKEVDNVAINRNQWKSESVASLEVSKAQAVLSVEAAICHESTVDCQNGDSSEDKNFGL